MKKLISVILAVVMLLCLGASALAVEETGTGDGTASSNVEYVATGTEQWKLTVPATIVPGTEPAKDNVTFGGTWPIDTKYIVTVPENVELFNSINVSDTKVLDVEFSGIELAGSNTETVSAGAKISVEDIGEAIFGTWSGTLEYTVTRDVTSLENASWTFNETIADYEDVFEVYIPGKVDDNPSTLKYTCGDETGEYEIFEFALTEFEVGGTTYYLLADVHRANYTGLTCVYIPENSLGIEEGWYLCDGESFWEEYDAGGDLVTLFNTYFKPYANVTVVVGDSNRFNDPTIAAWLYANATLVTN